MMRERQAWIREEVARARREAADEAEALARAEMEAVQNWEEDRLNNARLEDLSQLEAEEEPEQQRTPERGARAEGQGTTAGLRIRTPEEINGAARRGAVPRFSQPNRHDPGRRTAPRRVPVYYPREEVTEPRALPPHPAERNWAGARVRPPAEGLFPQMDVPDDVAPPAPSLPGRPWRRRPVFRTRLDPRMYSEEARNRILALREHADEWYHLASEEAERGRAGGRRYAQAMENGRANELEAEENEDQEEEIIRRRGEEFPNPRPATAEPRREERVPPQGLRPLPAEAQQEEERMRLELIDRGTRERLWPEETQRETPAGGPGGRYYPSERREIRYSLWSRRSEHDLEVPLHQGAMPRQLQEGELRERGPVYSSLHRALINAGTRLGFPYDPRPVQFPPDILRPEVARERGPRLVSHVAEYQPIGQRLVRDREESMYNTAPLGGPEHHQVLAIITVPGETVEANSDGRTLDFLVRIEAYTENSQRKYRTTALWYRGTY